MKKDFLTVGETAEYLGVSKSYIYKLTQQKKLPAFKVACRWMFDKNELDKWYKNQCNYVR